tara:strand:+ start:825 stop:1727 length:903 start_codon:yes stop_codon:yes gene_type:complete
MKLFDEIKNIIENPIPPTKQLDQHGYGNDGNPSVVLSATAPQELKDLAGDNPAELVSVNPYQIKFDGNEEIFTIYPSDIVLENQFKKDVLKYTNDYINYITGGRGKKKINEVKTQKDVIAIYPGRFQPMGLHHYKAYQKLVDDFGVKNVYVATSDVTGPKSPFSFSEKKKIIRSYGVPANRIVKVKDPYKSIEITTKYPEDTPVVFGFGAKDAGRLSSGKYFKDYKKGIKLVGYRDNGYITTLPHIALKVNGKEMSGTAIRKSLGSKKSSDTTKLKLFKSIFGHTKKDVFDIIINRLKTI